MLRYLQAFTAAFQLHKLVQFDTEVTTAVPTFSHSHQQQPQQQSEGPQAAADSNGNAHVATNGQSHHQSPLPWPKWQITTQRVHHERQRNSTKQLLKLEQANGRQASASKFSNDPSDDSLQDGNVLRSHGTHSHAQTDDLQPPEGGSQPDSDTHTDSQSQTATYDALVVCNGHYSAPRCPEVKGSDVFPGQVMHSHNYRHNEAFKGQTVVLVGASASGEDICREIAEVADKVITLLPLCQKLQLCNSCEKNRIHAWCYNQDYSASVAHNATNSAWLPCSMYGIFHNTSYV